MYTKEASVLCTERSDNVQLGLLLFFSIIKNSKIQCGQIATLRLLEHINFEWYNMETQNYLMCIKPLAVSINIVEGLDTCSQGPLS